MPHGVDIVRESNLLGLNLEQPLKIQLVLVWLIGKIISIKSNLYSTTNRPLCQQFGVRGYPTIKLIHPEGNTYDYASGRTLESFQAFVNGEFRNAESNPTPIPDWKDKIME